MHPVIMRQVATDHIREMHAKVEDERLARQAAPGPASRVVHATKASGQRDAQLRRSPPGRRPAPVPGPQSRGSVRGSPKRARSPRSLKRVITETWFPRSVSTTKLLARQIGAQGSAR